MRNRIRDILSLFALISIFIEVQAIVVFQYTDGFIFSVQLLILSATIFFIQDVIVRLNFKSLIMGAAFEVTCIFVMVVVSGLLFKWTELDNLFYNTWVVLPVYIISFALRMTLTMKEVMEVNELIKRTQNYD